MLCIEYSFGKSKFTDNEIVLKVMLYWHLICTCVTGRIWKGINHSTRYKIYIYIHKQTEHSEMENSTSKVHSAFQNKRVA